MNSQKQGMFSGKILSIIITMLIILIGTAVYFTSAETPSDMSKTKSLNENAKDTKVVAINPDIIFLINDMNVKIAYNSKGELKLFAYAPSSRLLKIEAQEGISAPSESAIIGYEEAKTMKEKGAFRFVGSKLNNLFGIDTEIGGVLARTGTLIDYIYFLDYHQFNELNGREDRIFFKVNSEGVAKFFYDYNLEEPLSLELSEGNIKDYQMHNIGGQEYYPIILGSEEAKIMKEEKLFGSTGDIIKGFFGKDVVIIGILKEGSALDKIYLIPLDKYELK